MTQTTQGPENRPLHLYLASAGSGKTYTLTHAYLELALSASPDKFKHIVAITFTNRATEAMRDRLLKTLDDLRNERGTSHISLGHTLRLSHEALKKRAGDLLEHILHHYSSFCICTMDVFFLRLMRAFLLETGLSGNLYLTLDTTPARKKMVSELLAAVGKNEVITRWLQHFLEERLSMPEGYNWSLEEDLFAFSEEIFKETFREVFPEEGPHSEDIWKGMQSVAAHRYRYEKHLTAQARQILNLIQKAGYRTSDFSRNAGISILHKIVHQKIFFRHALLTSSVEKAAVDPLLLLKKADRSEAIGTFVEHQLAPLFTQLIHILSDSEQSTLYNSLRAIQSHIHHMGITSYMLDALREYRSHESMFFLSDVLDILRRLTQHTYVPYVYEKVGTFFRHYLLDEFQDTSLFQWRALEPLILEGIAQRRKQCLVGDVKQSIYRWRGAAATQLLSEVTQRTPPYSLHKTSLQTNWRSAKQIVEFNNQLFTQLLHLPIFKELDSDTLRKTYENTEQTTPSNTQSNEGYVTITGFEQDEHLPYIEQAHHWCCAKIDALLAQGYRAEDICILVRKKKEGAHLLQALLKHTAQHHLSYQVCTQESFLLAQAPPVQLLVYALRILHYSPIVRDQKQAESNHSLVESDYFHLQYLEYTLRTQQAPSDKDMQTWRANKTFSPTIQTFLRQRMFLLHLPLYLLCERLIDMFSLHSYERYRPFVYDFTALLFTYQKQYGQSISAFLTYWEEQSSRASLSSLSDLRAIQILTIHKAKGLEFPVVLMPYVTWSLQSEHPSYLWKKAPAQSLLSELPFLVFKYKKDLAHTCFADTYAEEKIASYVDALNLLYVACTRPQKELHMCYYHKSKDAYNLRTVGDILHQLLGDNYRVFPKVSKKRSADRLLFEWGAAAKAPSVAPLQRPLSLTWQRPCDQEVTAQILTTSKTEHSAQKEGIQVHECLRTIHSWRDYEARKSEDVLAPDIVERLDELFELPKIKDWFSGSWEIKHEHELLIQGLVKRPDLVFLSSEAVHVADLKTGRPSVLHRKQVKEYVSILQHIYHQKILGFLLYIKPRAQIISV